jgi:hypothetical protein
MTDSYHDGTSNGSISESLIHAAGLPKNLRDDFNFRIALIRARAKRGLSHRDLNNDDAFVSGNPWHNQLTTSLAAASHYMVAAIDGNYDAELNLAAS